MNSYKELSKRMEILPFLYSVFIFTSLYVVNNKNLFTHNLEVHNHNTISANNFQLPITNLTKYQRELIMQELKFLIIFLLTWRV
jgi:hypothetical protein